MNDLICFFKGHDEHDTSFWTKDNLIMRGQELKHYIMQSSCKRCGKSKLLLGSNTWQSL